MKKGFAIILLLTGLFSLLIAAVSLGMEDELGSAGAISMFVLFLLIGAICFFFCRSIFISAMNDPKELKKESVELIKDIKDRKTEIEKLESRLSELSVEVNALYREKEKLELDKEKYKQIMKDYKDDLGIDVMEKIDKMDGIEFEDFTAKLLKKHGFKKVETTPASNDYGIDVLAEKDKVRYAFQCKNYSDTVGSKAIQEVYSGKNYYNCHVGVVVTNNYFTNQAINLAKKNDVLLWDRNKLISLIEKQ